MPFGTPAIEIGDRGRRSKESAAKACFRRERKESPVYFLVVAPRSKEATKKGESNFVGSSNELIRQKQRQAGNLRAEKARLLHMVQLQKALTQLQSTVASRASALAQKEVQKEAQIAHLTAKQEPQAQELDPLQGSVNLLQRTVQAQQGWLRAIQETLAWALISKYRRLRDRLFPTGSRRRTTYDLSGDAFKVLVRARGEQTASVRKSRESGLC
jgi:hypothetical protein